MPVRQLRGLGLRAIPSNPGRRGLVCRQAGSCRQEIRAGQVGTAGGCRLDPGDRQLGGRPHGRPSGVERHARRRDLHGGARRRGGGRGGHGASGSGAAGLDRFCRRGRSPGPPQRARPGVARRRGSRPGGHGLFRQDGDADRGKARRQRGDPVL